LAQAHKLFLPGRLRRHFPIPESGGLQGVPKPRKKIGQGGQLRIHAGVADSIRIETTQPSKNCGVKWQEKAQQQPATTPPRIFAMRVTLVSRSRLVARVCSLIYKDLDAHAGFWCVYQTLMCLS